MFSHLAAFVTATIALLSAASPTSVGADVCTSAQIAATCASMNLTTSAIGVEVLGLLDIVLPPTETHIALGCGPLVVVSRRDGSAKGVDVDVCCDAYDYLAAFGEVGVNCEAIVE